MTAAKYWDKVEKKWVIVPQGLARSTADALYVLKVGDTMTGGLTVTQGGITLDDDWLTINSGNFGGLYVEAGFEVYHDPATMGSRAIGFWRKSGASYQPLMATQPYEPATKSFVDSLFTAHVAAADPHPIYLTQTEGDGRYVNITGDTMTGALTVNADLTVAGSTIDIAGAAGSFYTATSRLGIEAYDGKEIRLLTDGGVSLEGGTIYLSSDNPIWMQDAAGLNPQRITNLSAPTSATDATNKQYADGLITAHEADPEPHPQYLTEERADARYAPIAHTHPSQTTVSATAPSSPLVGDLWAQTPAPVVLHVWDGTEWQAT